jgi:26S proteasome regulatory subunit (ATPase 3-interacting protein)
MRTDTLSKQESEQLMEDLGVELDTPEHIELEQSALCTKPTRPAKSAASKRR